ncbi:MAG TPA: AAA family ATPase [Ignavibacteria bacterium]|nr:AAA family ATPase [Ignavibacteria bacterium]HMR41413.1 AAA family ATPase [Ignavibacteria bacterium]
MTKQNFYVLTGGPGGGKTSLLENLAGKGYSYVPDEARRIIRERISRGLPPRPEPEEFAMEIFRRDRKNFNKNIDVTTPLFFDRSFIDSAGMLSECDINIYNRIRHFHITNRFNQKVFITPPWEEIYRTDSERDQTFTESVRVYEKIMQLYIKSGYEMIELPKNTIEVRAQFILEHISNL